MSRGGGDDTVICFGLFFLRKEDIAALVFGIFCFLVSIRLFFIGDVWITSIYPSLDWNWMYRFEYLSLYFSAPTFTLFSYYVFTSEFNKKVLYLTLPISLVTLDILFKFYTVFIKLLIC